MLGLVSFRPRAFVPLIAALAIAYALSMGIEALAGPFPAPGEVTYTTGPAVHSASDSGAVTFRIVE